MHHLAPRRSSLRTIDRFCNVLHPRFTPARATPISRAIAVRHRSSATPPLAQHASLNTNLTRACRLCVVAFQFDLCGARSCPSTSSTSRRRSFSAAAPCGAPPPRSTARSSTSHRLLSSFSKTNSSMSNVKLPARIPLAPFAPPLSSPPRMQVACSCAYPSIPTPWRAHLLPRFVPSQVWIQQQRRPCSCKLSMPVIATRRRQASIGSRASRSPSAASSSAHSLAPLQVRAPRFKPTHRTIAALLPTPLLLPPITPPTPARLTHSTRRSPSSPARRTQPARPTRTTVATHRHPPHPAPTRNAPQKIHPSDVHAHTRARHLETAKTRTRPTPLPPLNLPLSSQRAHRKRLRPRSRATAAPMAHLRRRQVPPPHPPPTHCPHTATHCHTLATRGHTLATRFAHTRCHTLTHADTR